MAKAPMETMTGTVSSGVEILHNAEYVGEAMTLDTTAFTDGVCLAGTPIDADGKIAVTTAAAGDNPASSNVMGILLSDVQEARPQGTIVIGGYINTAVAQTNSGVTYDAATKDALKNVVFM